MQQDTKALQVSKVLPRKTRTVKGETADCTGLSLTLPTLLFSHIKKYFVNNRNP